MTNAEKIDAIKYVYEHPGNESVYYDLIENIDDKNLSYYDFMTTQPIDCNKELERISEADFDLCVALLTMLLREDHFSNGSLVQRYEEGSVDAILLKMIELLK